MRILIINLTRMGDLIQTIGLINKIKITYPAAKIDILVMKAFSPIINHIKHINETICINDEILNNNLVDNIWDGYTEIFETISKLNNYDYDILYNPIISQQSALLTLLINAKKKLGLQTTVSNEQKMTCDYISYLLANQHKVGDFSFNLVDIFAGMVSAPKIRDVELNVDTMCITSAEKDSETIGASLTSVRSGERDKAVCISQQDVYSNTTQANISINHADVAVDTMCITLIVRDDDLSNINGFIEKLCPPPAPPMNEGRENGNKIIAFHIGASQSNKAWNIKYYHKVITELLKEKRYIIVLFGGYKEKSFKSYFEDINDKYFINTIGDFSLNEFIAAISKIDLLVTNDTGPMHIAVALGKEIIDISLGPVSKWETGPYSEKATIVQAKLNCHPCGFTYSCPHWNCQHFISPEVIIELIKCKINGTSIKPSEKTKTVRVFETEFDMFGYHSVKPVFREEISYNEFIFAVKRFIWSLYFSNSLSESAKYKQRFFDKINADYIVPHFNFVETKSFLSSLIELIMEILENLKNVSPDKKALDRNKRLLLKVKTVKEELFKTASRFELIYDMFWFVIFKESEIEEYDIYKISRATMVLYEKLKIKIKLLKDLLP